MLEMNSITCDDGEIVCSTTQPQHYHNYNSTNIDDDDDEKEQQTQQHEHHHVWRPRRCLSSFIAVAVLLTASLSNLITTTRTFNIIPVVTAQQVVAVHPPPQQRRGPHHSPSPHSHDPPPQFTSESSYYSQHFVGPLLIPLKVNVGGEWTSSLGKIHLEDLYHLTGGSVVTTSSTRAHAHARAGASLAKTKLHPLVHHHAVGGNETIEETQDFNVVDATTTTTITPIKEDSKYTDVTDDDESAVSSLLHIEQQALYDYNNVTTAATITNGLTANETSTSSSTSTNHRPLNILFLSSDTGGGHRASAESLAKVFVEELGGPSNITYELLDIWREEGVWPYNTLVESYQRLSHQPRKWQFMYHWSNFRPIGAMYNLHAYATCVRRIQRRFVELNPDLVVSVHPGMNFVPVRAIRRINRERRRRKTAEKQQQLRLSGGDTHTSEISASISSSSTAWMPSIDSEKSKSSSSALSVTANQDNFEGDIPFFTVVTDYGGAHNQWFDRLANHIYIASKPLEDIAVKRRNVSPSNLSLIGLPIRQSFTQQAFKLGDRTTDKGKAYQHQVRQSLGLIGEDDVDNNKKVILVMGGGEGVGSLEAIVEELSQQFSLSEQNVTIVVVCGRNERLREKLNSRTQHSTTVVNVIGLGFVSNIDLYMVSSDLLITKAGPGTIAEATALGLPLILTSYIPGQEYGNIDLVVKEKFGVYETNPQQVANMAHEWLSDSNKDQYNQLSRNALTQGRPNAARDIVQDILKRI